MINPFVAALELAAFLVSLLCWRNGNAIAKLITIILLLTVVNEWWLVPVLAKQQGLSRNVFYNAFSLADVIIWTGVFSIIQKKQKWRMLIILLGIVSLAGSFLEIEAKGWHTFHTDSMRFFSICIILFCLLYFYSQFHKVYHHLTSDWLFWICTACFLFHSLLFVSFTTLSRPDYFSIHNAERFFFILHNVSNTLYYGLLIIAFLVCRFRFFKSTVT